MSASEEPSFNVSVFHFTSRISSAKIRKYKSATEKGMGPLTGSGRTPTPGPSNRRSTPTSAPGPETSEQPPAKKQRLKLKVRDPTPNGQSLSQDTIAVSRPRRGSAIRAQYSENMDVDDVEEANDSLIHKPRSASAASTSSSLTSLSSTKSAEKPPVSAATVVTKKPTKKGDYNTDFLSYYVTGDADADDEFEGEEQAPTVAPVKVPPTTKVAAEPKSGQQPPKTIPPAAQAQKLQHRPPPYPVPRDTKFRNHTGPPGPYPTSAKERPFPQPAPQPLPQPCVHVMDNMAVHSEPRAPVTVAAMVAKLEYLSITLANFGGGLPPRPLSPVLQQSLPIPTPTPPATAAQNPAIATISSSNTTDGPVKSTEPKEKSAAAGLLAMFDDDSEASSDESKTDASAAKAAPPVQQPPPTPHAVPAVNANHVVRPLDYLLENPGAPDAALYYGIKFIQNALRSWARQRLNTEYAHFYWAEHHRHSSQHQPQKRGPGRPRKFDDDPNNSKLPPANIRMDLAHTNEGRAIAAFQDVLESGCLQVNVTLPIELSRALRILYAQIDQLINQVPKMNMPWQCLSYDVQITANKIRVDEWKEARARATAEMERQQMLAQQQVMQQMGIRSGRSGMSNEQPQNSPVADFHRRSSSNQELPRTHQSPYPPLPPAGQTAFVNAVPPVSVPNGTPTTSGMPHILPNAAPIPSSPASVHGVPLANLLSRSGQSMKFSFDTSSELARKALPNRGPMGAGSSSPSVQTSSSPRLFNGTAAAATTTAQQPQPAHAAATEHPSDTIHVAHRPSSRQNAQSSSAITKQAASVQNGGATTNTKQTLIHNIPSPGNPVASSLEPPPPKPSSSGVSNGNITVEDGKAAHQSHLDAVVVD